MASGSSRPKFKSWQKYLDKTVLALKERGLIEEFERINNISDKVDFIENVTSPKPAWILEFFTRCHKWQTSKCEKKAVDYRLAGNRHFQEKNYVQALQSYNLCIQFAIATNPSEDNQISLGYANRSAVLFRLGHIQRCLGDIELALDNNYPPHLAYKLHQRRALCFQKLGQVQPATEAVEKACMLLCQTEMPQIKKEKHKSELRQLESELQMKSAPSKLKADEFTAQLPEPVHGYSDVIVQASKDIDLAWNSDRGRHLVANNTIKAGSVLIVEKPYASVLLPPYYSTHCHHCYGRLLILIPCHHCTDVGYCSVKCQKESWEIYHRTECRYLDLLHSVGVAHLSLRVILTAGLDELLEFHKKYTRSDPPGLNPAGKYERNYISVYELMAHTADIQTEDLIQYALTAGLLLRLLSESEFFPNYADGTKGKRTDQHYVGGLLLHHICQLVCNAHAITELHLEAVSQSCVVESQSQVRIATAIYPTVSLMNHSCDPTIISSFKKDVLIVRSIKDVKPGEEIFNCYGPHYCRMPFEERQQCLYEQYFFHCQCTACQKHEGDEEELHAFKCPECEGPLITNKESKGTCNLCNHVIDSSQEVELFETSKVLFIRGLKALENGSLEDAISYLTHCHQIRNQILYKYNKDLAEIHDILARCFAIKGNYCLSCTYLQPSLEITQKIYGTNSIELANELQKYSEVLYSARELKKALITAEQSRDIFKLNYGENHEIVLELNDFIMKMKSLELDHTHNSR